MTDPLERLRQGRRLTRVTLGIGIAGLILFGIGLLANPRQAYASYLVAYVTALSLALGTLLMVMIGHVTNAVWFVVLRRVSEGVAATLPVFVLLFLPLLLGLDTLYPWAAPLVSLSPDVQQRILAKQGYLNVPFFIVRAAIYFAIWIAFALLLRRESIRQDTDPSTAPLRRQRLLSAGGLPPVALALTFASFDWLMSLTPAWWSTIYGVYYFAGAMVGALALVAVIAYACQRAGVLTYLLSPDHYHALGKLLLTFVIFWAYIAFSQYLIIWIADIPAEASWYVIRTRGSWGALGLVLLFGHFVIPFLLLLSRDLKRKPRFMAGLGIWLLVMHYLDVYWLAMPSVYADGVPASWLDLAALLAVGGIAVAYGSWQLRGHAAVPSGDPELAESLEYGKTWAMEE